MGLMGAEVISVRDGWVIDMSNGEAEEAVEKEEAQICKHFEFVIWFLF